MTIFKLFALLAAGVGMGIAQTHVNGAFNNVTVDNTLTGKNINQTYSCAVTGDIGACVNAAVASIGSGNPGVIEIQPGNGTATTLITLGKGQTLRKLGRGTLVHHGIRFTDSQTQADTTATGTLECPDKGTLQLANGLNIDGISQVNFSYWHGLDVASPATGYPGGLWRTKIQGCVIDGNAYNATTNPTGNTSGRGVAIYGWAEVFDDLTIQNVPGDCLYTEWSGAVGGTQFLTFNPGASFDRMTILNCGGKGWYNLGPSDSSALNLQIAQAQGGGYIAGAYGDTEGDIGDGAGTTLVRPAIYNNNGGGIFLRTASYVIGADVSSGNSSFSSPPMVIEGGSIVTGGVYSAGYSTDGAIDCKGSGNVVSGVQIVNTTNGIKMECAGSTIDADIQFPSLAAYLIGSGEYSNNIRGNVNISGSSVITNGSWSGSDMLNVPYWGSSSGVLYSNPFQAWASINGNNLFGSSYTQTFAGTNKFTGSSTFGPTTAGTAEVLINSQSGRTLHLQQLTSLDFSVYDGLYNYIDCSGSTGFCNFPTGIQNVVLPSSRVGTFTCPGGGPVTVTNATAVATSMVTFSLKSVGGTITTPPAMKTPGNGSSFTVLCGSTDTSVYNYYVWN